MTCGEADPVAGDAAMANWSTAARSLPHEAANSATTPGRKLQIEIFRATLNGNRVVRS